MRRLRVGLLGCGRIARVFHLPILAALDGVELVAVAEPDPGSRAAAGDRAPGAALDDDWEETVARGGLDAVVVCLPSGLHAEAARLAFEAGLHVYLEKPIATTIEDGRAVLAAWRASDAVGMTGFDQRFEPAVAELARAVRAGAIGRIVGARLAMGSGRRDPPAWKLARASGGGALLDMGSHLADLTRFVLGEEVREVSGFAASGGGEDETAAFTMTTEGGALAQAWVTLTGITESRIEVVGRRGALAADRYAGTLLASPLEPPWSRVGRGRAAIAGLGRASLGVLGAARRAPMGQTYRAALSTFAAAAADGRPVSPDIDDGFRSLAIVLAAEESARTGRAVLLHRIG